MKNPPLLLSRPTGAQVVIAILVPALFGAITGVLLTVSEPVYLVLSLLGILGGIGAGYEHPNPGEGALRGFCGGLLFGTTILMAAALVGDPATAELLEPTGVLVAVTTVLGVAFGALGGRLRRRHDAR